MNKLEKLFQNLVKQAKIENGIYHFTSSYYSWKKKQTFEITWTCSVENLNLFCFELLHGDVYRDLEISLTPLDEEKKLKSIDDAYRDITKNITQALNKNYYVYYLATQWFHNVAK